MKSVKGLPHALSEGLSEQCFAHPRKASYIAPGYLGNSAAVLPWATSGADSASRPEAPMSGIGPAPSSLPAPPSGWHAGGSGAAVPVAATPEETLWILVGQIQNLAPQLSPASLVAASGLIGGLSPVAPRQSTAMQSAMNAEDPLVPAAGDTHGA